MNDKHKDLSPVEKALLTWYEPDNPKYKDPLHPTMKLAGEVGELLDLYAKHLFKPGFDWMNCKHCGNEKDYPYHSSRLTNFCNYTPLVLDELGDIWYYLRILAWIYGLELSYIVQKKEEPECSPEYSIQELISSMLTFSSQLFAEFLEFGENCGNESDYLLWIIDRLVGILNSLDCTLEELTELNYLKLNSDDTNHGWKDAL